MPDDDHVNGNGEAGKKPALTHSGPPPEATAEVGGPQDKPTITMSRSAYWGVVITAMVGIALGAFFAGHFVASYSIGATASDDYVTRAQLQEVLDRVAAVSAGTTQPAAAPPQKLIVSLDDDPVLGDPDAPVTIVEFSDFECPFCARFYHETMPLIVHHYVDTGAVKMVYKDFPIDRIHPNARTAHIAAECAHEQGAFWPYHDMLFERQPEWSALEPAEASSVVVEYARMLSLDADAFSDCLLDPAIRAEIDSDKDQGVRYGTAGTPAFYIGNDQVGYTQVDGAKPFETFVKVINQSLG